MKSLKLGIKGESCNLYSMVNTERRHEVNMVSDSESNEEQSEDDELKTLKLKLNKRTEVRKASIPSAQSESYLSIVKLVKFPLSKNKGER